MTSKPRRTALHSLLDSVCTVMAAYVIIAVVVTILGLAYRKPTSQSGSQLWKDLSNAKQIYLGMKMYAADHNGQFPSKTSDGRPLKNSNEAFRLLVPNYIPTKQIFYSKASPWTPEPPSGHPIPGKTPLVGENHFAYIPNLIDTDNPSFPFIASGFAKGTPGVYSSANNQTGTKSSTFEVVVVRVDGSGKIESGTTDNYRIYDRIDGNNKRDIFKPAPGWLRPDQVPLNPEG